MNIFKVFNPMKNREEEITFVEDKYDKDAQLILQLHASNISDLTLGKIDELTYEINEAEIENMAMRMVERRVTNLEQRSNSGSR